MPSEADIVSREGLSVMARKLSSRRGHEAHRILTKLRTNISVRGDDDGVMRRPDAQESGIEGLFPPKKASTSSRHQALLAQGGARHW